jgi:hypothetical protein
MRWGRRGLDLVSGTGSRKEERNEKKNVQGLSGAIY